MDPSKLCEDLTWANLIIVADKLKGVWEFDSKTLKHKDFRTVCSQMKSKGWKMHEKRRWYGVFLLFSRSMKDTASSQMILMLLWHKQERSPSALTGWLTSGFLIGLLKALKNLGMWLIGLNLTLENYHCLEFFLHRLQEHFNIL